MPIEPRKIEKIFAVILTLRVIYIKIIFKSTNIVTGIPKIMKFIHISNPKNSSQFFKTYTIYTYYFGKFFLFSTFLYSNIIAILHHFALIYLFIFP